MNGYSRNKDGKTDDIMQDAIIVQNSHTNYSIQLLK